MFVIYNLIILLLFLCLLPFSLVLMPFKPSLRREFSERLGFYPKKVKQYLKGLQKVKQDIIWINAASVGEIMIAQLLIGELVKINPDLGFIMVTNSRSGQQMANKLFGAEKVILQPLDLHAVTRRVAQKVKPKLAILVEFEMWPNTIHDLSKVGSKVVLINGAMDNKILKYYRIFPGLLKGALNKLDYLGMKREEEKEKVKNLGVTSSKIRVTGDMKYDGSSKTRQKDKSIALKNSLNIPENAQVLVAGSTHPGEEEIIFKVYSELKGKFKDLVLVIVPRQIERTAEIQQLGAGYNLKPIERSKFTAKHSKGTVDNEVIIVDTIGELADLYGVSTIAFVGGSFAEIGGHNLLEPVFYGKPVLFGPNIYKVKKTADWLVENQIGFMVRNEEELKMNSRLLLQDQNRLQTIKERARELLKAKEGATQKNIKVIRGYLVSKHN